MHLVVKNFEQLTKKELYEILRLRMEVFIVEQGGRYQDLDQIDYESIHIFFEEENEILGCLRMFLKPDEKETMQLGRIVCKNRKAGMGRALIEQATLLAKEQYHARELYLTGREDALDFYVKCGFHTASEKLGTAGHHYYLFRKSL